MTSKNKNWLKVGGLIVVALVIGAFQYSAIQKFVNDKAPWIGKALNKTA